MFNIQKTYVPKAQELKNDWVHINAEGAILGRLAVIIANHLRGKNKPQYSPHLDNGDFVVVTNANKIALTAKKRMQKQYFRHTGFPGGLKSRTADDLFKSNRAKDMILRAVKLMMSKGPHSRQLLKKLKIYDLNTHPHGAQNPREVNIADLNNKNIER